MPFHETNPFYLCDVCDVSHLCTKTYVVCSGVCKWVRSEKTNPFSGVYEGLGGDENGVVEKTNPKLPHTGKDAAPDGNWLASSRSSVIIPVVAFSLIAWGNGR